MKRHLLIALLLIGCLLGTAVSSQAQANEPRVAIERVDNSSFPTVSMVVTPLDAFGLPVGNLDPSQFTVLEDGQPVADLQVTQPTLEEQPVSVMLVLDVSGSLRNSLEELRQSALMLYDTLELADESGIIAFSVTESGGISTDITQFDPAREANFTNDEGLLINLINAIAIDENAGTPLYDALAKGVELTAQNARNSRRAVILFTDGEDLNRDGTGPGSSTFTDSDTVLKQVQQAGIPVFTIGLGDQVDNQFLQDVATVTGGTYTPIKDVNFMGNLFARSVSVIRPAYRLTYSSQLPLDGAAHTVSVSVNMPNGTAVSETSINTPAPDLPAPPTISAVDVTPPDANGIIRVSPTLDSGGEIAAVRYYVDDVPEAAATLNTPPYLFEWDTAGLPLDEEHLLRIEVEDVFGQVSSITQAITVPASDEAIIATAVPQEAIVTEETAVVDEGTEEEGLLAQVESLLPFNPLFLLAVPLLLLILGIVLFFALRGRNRQAQPAAAAATPSPYQPLQSGGFTPPSVPLGQPNQAPPQTTPFNPADPNATVVDTGFSQEGTPAFPDPNATMVDESGAHTGGLPDPNATVVDSSGQFGGAPDPNATVVDSSTGQASPPPFGHPDPTIFGAPPIASPPPPPPSSSPPANRHLRCS